MRFIIEPIKSKHDVQSLCKYFANDNERNFLIFIFGINTGLRVSDILGLNVEDVIHRNYIEIVEKKTQKRKRFALNRKLKYYIQRYLDLEYGVQRPYSIEVLKNPLFCGQRHTRLTRTAVYRFLKKASQKVGIKNNVGTHTMRKTFGFFFYRKYKDIILLQKIFNHAHPAITMRYIGLDQEEIDISYINFEL